MTVTYDPSCDCGIMLNPNPRFPSIESKEKGK